MGKITPLAVAPEEWDEEEPEVQAIPDPEDPPAPVPAPVAAAPAPEPSAADLYLQPRELPEVPANLPTIKLPGEDKPKGKIIPLAVAPEEWVEPEKPANTSWLSNVGRGIGERGVELVGGTAGTIGRIAEGAGDWLDQNLGKPVWDENGLGWRQMTPEETAGTSSWITQKLMEVEKGMNDPDFGYDARTSWEDVKNAPFTNVIPFAIEAGLVSAPDMIAAVRNAPAYIIEQAGEIGAERATNEGRTEATFGDIMKALPAATVSAWMEKLGTTALMGRFAGGEAILSEMKQLPKELLKTLLTEGATEAAQQAAQYGGGHAFTQQGIDWWEAAEEVGQAAIVGAIFGPAVRTATGTAEVVTAKTDDDDVENTDVETEDKVDDAAEISAETQPEGASTTAAAGAGAGTSTPGGLGATTPAQPAGVEKQPVIDPRVTVTQPDPAGKPAPVATGVDPAVAAVLGTAPNAPTAEPTEALTEDLDEEEDVVADGATEVELAAHEARIRDMFAQEGARTQEKAAQATKVAKAGEDLAAAMAARATAPPEPQPNLTAPVVTSNTPQPAVTPETLGTRQALGPAPAGQVAAVAPVAPDAQEIATAGPQPTPPIPLAETQEAAPQTLPPAPAPELELAPDIQQIQPQLPLAPDIEPLPQGRITPLATAPIEFTPQELAAFNTAPELEVAPDLSTLTKGEQLKRKAAEKKVAPVKTGKLTLKSTPAAAPGAKGLALKAKAKGKTVYIPEKAAPKAAAAELIKRGDEAPRAEAVAPAPAPAPAAKAPRTNLSRDAAAAARDTETLRQSTVSELGNEFRETLEDVAAEHVQSVPRGERSPAQYFRDEATAIAGKVVARLREAAEKEDTARVQAAEYLTTYGKKKQAKKANQDAMAHAEEGQKKERSGKNKGKSAVGIRAESVDSTERAYAADLKRKPEKRSPELLQWGQLRAQQKKLPKADVAGRAALQTQMDELQEARAVAAELVEGQEQQLSERALEAERQSSEAIESVAKPRKSGTDDEQLASVNKHFDDFIAATKNLVLHPHHDTKHQSAAENLVIYARKVEKNLKIQAAMNKAQYEGIGPTDFAAARELYDIGAIDEMNGMVVTETLGGGGYSEALGLAPEQAWTEDEDVGERREHESEEGYEVDIEFIRRRGRDKARAGAAKEGKVETGARTRGKVNVYARGARPVVVEAETEKASSVLKTMAKWLNEGDDQKGFWAVLRNAHVRHLMKLVGDVDVHFISGADMDRIVGKDPSGVVGGVYLNYSNAARANGYKPAVFINLEGNDGRRQMSHTIIHELTHAATSQALRDNVRGTAKILDAMRKNMRYQLLKQYSEQELRDKGLWYAFTDESEFLAEAFSNVAFQEMMATLVVPLRIRSQISALGKGSAPTWWDAFTATVSNAIGMISGQRGQTYMEQVIALNPHIMRSSSTQQFLAHREYFGPRPKPLPRPEPDSMYDSQMLIREAQNTFEAAKGKVENFRAGKGRLRDRFATTGELIRRGQNLGTKFGEALEKLAKVHLKRDNLLKKFRDSPGAGVDNNQIQRAVLKLMRHSKDQFAKAGHLLDDMTRWQVNATVALNHADNKHVSKAGQRGEDSRVAHAQLAKEFAALQPATQKVIKDVIAHYKKTFEIENMARIHNSLRQVLKGYHKQLPPGKTLDDAVAWAMSPGPKRDAANQTAEDKLYHAALGNTAKTLGNITSHREIKGVYVPMRRRGRLFIAVKDRVFGTLKNQKNVPPGALLEAVTAEEQEAPNRLLFRDRKDYDAFVASTPYQVTGTTRWIDPATGKKVPHTFAVADPSVPGGIRKAEKLFVATVQNNRMEMSDNKKKLDARAKELIKQGHKVSAMRVTERDLYQVAEEIAPAQIKALIGNLEQTTLGKNTAGQAAVKGAILDAQIRMMNSPGRLERHLKRRNVLGNETDIFESLVDYNRGLASAMTNYQLGPEMAEADAELQEVMRSEAKRQYNNDTALAQQSMASELRGRIKDTQYVSGPKILSVVKDITFLRHLASPHYTLIQLTQPFMMTMPILSSKYGRGAAWKEIMRAMYMGGVHRSLGRGFKESWKGFTHLNPYSGPKDSVNMDDFWRDVVKGEKDAALLTAGIEAVVELGYGASSGIEAADVSEAGMSKPAIALKRMVDMARALPESAESVNRYTTMIAAIRLAKRKGLSDAAAIREGVLTVEETQGGYGAANNPAFFNNPYLAPAVQFRKFSLAYGQLFYRNLAWSIRHADPEQKKIARKSVARLALMTVATAGVFGLAPMEIARHLINVAALLGWKDDDWEETENQLQAWVAEATSEGISEALFRGAPRIFNLDLSGSLGVDNLALFGSPEELKSEDIQTWIAKMMFGAMGGMVAKSLDAYQNADSFLGGAVDAIPWPKAIKNLMDAKDLAFTGTTDKKTGEVYMEPVGVIEAVYKALGFRTASEAREWEVGGGGYENRQERKLRSERRTLMGRWANASPSERHEIFTEDIREWNHEHRKNPDMKIDMGDLRKSKKERERRQKERQQ